MQKNALLLISGGIDSPVAAELAMQKGFSLKAIYFSFEPFADNVPEQKTNKILKKFNFKEFFLAQTGNEFKIIATKADHRYYFVLMKRFMLKVAESLAKKKGIGFLLTGENIGQVSSQTLSNLSVIDKSVSIPVLRPLLPLNKQEIIDLAKEIGTYDISTGPEICDVLGPTRPVTQTTQERVLEQEKKCEMENLVNQAVEKIEVKEISN